MSCLDSRSVPTSWPPSSPCLLLAYGPCGCLCSALNLCPHDLCPPSGPFTLPPLYPLWPHSLLSDLLAQRHIPTRTSCPTWLCPFLPSSPPQPQLLSSVSLWASCQTCPYLPYSPYHPTLHTPICSTCHIHSSCHTPLQTIHPPSYPPTRDTPLPTICHIHHSCHTPCPPYPSTRHTPYLSYPPTCHTMPRPPPPTYSRLLSVFILTLVFRQSLFFFDPFPISSPTPHASQWPLPLLCFISALSLSPVLFPWS